MPPPSYKNLPGLFTGLLAVVLFAYTAYRAFNLSMTHDESGSFLYWMDLPLMDCFFKAGGWPSANLHWLYWFLERPSLAIWGDNELGVRFPSLLAHLLYLSFSYLLLKIWSSNNWAMVLGFALLNINPYLLEFFALGRGYALAISFIMVSIYCFALWLKKGGGGVYVAGLFGAASLAVLSNLTALNYYAVIFALFFGVLLLKRSAHGPGKLLVDSTVAMAFSLFLFLLLKTPVSFLRDKNELYYGTNSLYETIRSIVNNSLYGTKYFSMYNVEVFGSISLLLLVFALTHSLLDFRKAKFENKNIFYLSVCLMPLLVCLGTVIQNFWFGTPYLVDRTALLLIPLTALPIALLCLDLLEKKNKWNWALPVLITVFCIVHACLSFNTSHSREWWFDAKTREMLLYLDGKIPEGRKIQLGVKWLYQPTATFYIQTMSLDFSAPPTYEKEYRKDTLYDYYYIAPDEQSQIHPSYQLEKDFSFGGILMKRQ